MDMVVIEIHEPARPPRRVNVTGVMEIGRECTGVVLDDESVSRRHVTVAPHAEGLAVTDLGSRNGTFLNGAAIAGTVTVRPGDVVRFGGTELSVVERSATWKTLAQTLMPGMAEFVEEPVVVATPPPPLPPSVMQTAPVPMDDTAERPAPAAEPPAAAPRDSTAKLPVPAAIVAEPVIEEPAPEPPPRPAAEAAVLNRKRTAMLSATTADLFDAAHRRLNYELDGVGKTELMEAVVSVGLDHLGEVSARLSKRRG